MGLRNLAGNQPCLYLLFDLSQTLAFLDCERVIFELTRNPELNFFCGDM